MAAALDIFVERGYAASKLEDVARRAGVSKGTVYLYFRDKEDLFRAVVERTVLPTVERGEAIVDRFDGSSADLLRALLLDWWDSIRGTHRSGITKLIVSESRNFPRAADSLLKRVVLRRRRLLERVLERGIARGEFRPLDPALAVRLAVAPILLASIWEHSFPAHDRHGIDPREMIRLHAEIFLAGIARGAGRARGLRAGAPRGQAGRSAARGRDRRGSAGRGGRRWGAA
ncbi:MAG TPA: helix-turn-helix domain-containing protein [Candidatus Eisenbacteria bacterium]